MYHLAMASSFSSLFLEPRWNTISVTRPSYHSAAKRFLATTVSNDPHDTHQDFKPTNKLHDSPYFLKDIVEQDVKDNPVMIYMKGVPDQPRCGFSSLAVRVLKEYNVLISARNILEDPELTNAVKAFSTWPTFPQIFIKGEFIGGSDIILNMHQNLRRSSKTSLIWRIFNRL